MAYAIITGLLGVIYAALELRGLKIEKVKYSDDRRKLAEQLRRLEDEQKGLEQEHKALDEKIAECFFFYDLTRKIAPVLTKPDLFKVFFEEIRFLGQASLVEEAGQRGEGNCFELALDPVSKETWLIKTSSQRVIEYLPYFSSLLGLSLERIDLYERLQKLSIYDSLTQVYNRRYFSERFAEEFERAKSFNFEVSFLMVDIDFFKKINDTYGHLVGDAVLSEVARFIQESIREIDFVGRMGGEEFAVILPETDKTGAIMAAERIRSRIDKEKIRAFDEAVNTTVSIGIASYPDNTLHQDVLAETADKALYKAKVSGRNKVCWF